MSYSNFKDGWNSAPWQLKLYAVFLLGLAGFELGCTFWSLYRGLEVPHRRHTMEVGFMMSAPVTYYAIERRWRRLQRGLVVLLAIQVVYVVSIFALFPRRDPEAIAWVLTSSLLWMALLASPAVRRFCSAHPPA
jgi:uncharacterized membrane protein YedE/YeeE